MDDFAGEGADTAFPPITVAPQRSEHGGGEAVEAQANFGFTAVLFHAQVVAAHGAHGALLHKVRCELQLNCQGQIYTLRSVVAHSGATAASGHYTARIHCPTTAGDWWYYNNSLRRLATPAEVDTTADITGVAERSYLLLYDKE